MNKYWFKPKGFGYGATPTTWEGWLVVIIFVLFLFSLSYKLKEGKILEYIIYLVLGIITMIIITKNKTDGVGKWNWRRNYFFYISEKIMD